MKKILLKYFLLAFLLFLCNRILGQTITTLVYSYDETGNREQRRIMEISLKMTDTTSQDSSTQNNSQLIYTENIGDISVSIFPNPTQGKINLTFSGGDMPGDSKIEIYNETGTIIDDIFSSDKNQIIDFTAFADGIYYLKLIIGTSDKRFKIVKIH